MSFKENRWRKSLKKKQKQNHTPRELLCTQFENEDKQKVLVIKGLRECIFQDQTALLGLGLLNLLKSDYSFLSCPTGNEGVITQASFSTLKKTTKNIKADRGKLLPVNQLPNAHWASVMFLVEHRVESMSCWAHHVCTLPPKGLHLNRGNLSEINKWLTSEYAKGYSGDLENLVRAYQTRSLFGKQSQEIPQRRMSLERWIDTGGCGPCLLCLEL